MRKYQELYDNLADIVKKNIPRKLKSPIIVDLGCGPGLLTQKIFIKTPEVKIIGVDPSRKMLKYASKNVNNKNFETRLGSSEEIPVTSETSDIIVSRFSLIYWSKPRESFKEINRVLKPGGIIAFTDWLQVGNMTEDEWIALNSFMAFPYLETLEGYVDILKNTGFEIILTEDESDDFAKHCHMYQTMLRKDLKHDIIKNYGPEMFEAADSGLNLWVQAADSRKVGRGRTICKKILK